MNLRILFISTVVGILVTYLVFLIADLVFGVVTDDTETIVIALFIGSCAHFLVRYFLNKTENKPKY